MTTGKERFRLALQRVLKKPVTLIIHDNTHVFLNAYLEKQRWVVRLHWMFLKSPRGMAKQIARYLLTRNKKSSKLIDRYIEDRWHWVRHPLPPIQTKGKYFDLKKVFARLNRRYLKGKVTAKIGWGPKNNRRAYEQMQMGSYSTSRDLIAIHPNLDQKFVPKYVVEATIFHEMCHALVPVREVKGRKQIHPLVFKKLEAKYPHVEKAGEWEDKHLSWLLKKTKK